MKFQQLQSPLRKLCFPGIASKRAVFLSILSLGECAFVPVRMNKSSQAGLYRKLLNVVWERMPLWPRKTSFFTEMPLTVTSEHVNLKVSFSSAVHCLRYLNKRPNENYLKSNFHNENGNSKLHRAADCVTVTDLGRQRKRGAPEVCMPFHKSATLSLHHQEGWD